MPTPLSESTLVYDAGVHWLGSVLWMDPTRARPFSFVSRAGLPGIRIRGGTLTTPTTAALSATKSRTTAPLAIACPFDRAFDLGPLQLLLRPSGFIPGAAMLRVDDGESVVLYTGDFSLNARGEAPAAEPSRADFLVIKTDCIGPRTSTEDLIAAVGASLDAKQTTVLRVPGPEAAPELAALISALRERWDGPIGLQRGLASRFRALSQYGFPEVAGRSWRRGGRAGSLVAWPADRELPAPLADARVVDLTTGPLTTATLDETISLVDRVQPKCVLTVGRNAASIASELRDRDHPADTLVRQQHLPLESD